MNSQEINKTFKQIEMDSLQERAQRQIENFEMNSIQPAGTYLSLKNENLQANEMKPLLQTNEILQPNVQPIPYFQQNGMLQPNLQPQMINLQNRFWSNLIPQQIPHHIEKCNQQYLEVQNQFNQMMDNKFKVDSTGRIVQKPYQCHQCLTLCNFESVLKTHLEYCNKFSCYFSECRDEAYSTFYISNEEFKSKKNLETHIDQKDDQIVTENQDIVSQSIDKENHQGSFENKFTDQNSTEEDKFIVKEKTKSDNFLVDNLLGISSSNTENLKAKEDLLNLSESLDKEDFEKKQLKLTISKLEKENDNLKTKNTELHFINKDITEKLEKKTIEASISSNHLQAIRKAVNVVEENYRDQFKEAKQDLSDVKLACEDTPINNQTMIELQMTIA